MIFHRDDDDGPWFELVASIMGTRTPAHIVHAGKYPYCPEGANVTQWTMYKHYRYGLVDLIETGTWDCRFAAANPQYLPGVIDAVNWLDDLTAGKPDRGDDEAPS